MNNLKQDTVADLLKIKRKRYQAYEEGRAMAPDHILEAIASLFSLNSVDDLLYQEEEPTPEKPVKKLDLVAEKYREAPYEAKRIIDFILKIDR